MLDTRERGSTAIAIAIATYPVSRRVNNVRTADATVTRSSVRTRPSSTA